MINSPFVACSLDASQRLQVTSKATRLAGKVALITGGGTGIGRACALEFARQGAKVAIAGRRTDQLAAVAGEIRNGGGNAHPIKCDVTNIEQVEHAVRAVVDHFELLNVVVNNAGAMFPANAEQTSEAHWDLLSDTNLKGTFLISRASLRFLRRSGGGSIINMGSVYGLV